MTTSFPVPIFVYVVTMMSHCREIKYKRYILIFSLTRPGVFLYLDSQKSLVGFRTLLKLVCTSMNNIIFCIEVFLSFDAVAERWHLSGHTVIKNGGH